MSTELEKKFKKAVWLVRNGPPKKDTSNDEKLKFYSYFKQATEGDVKGDQPWAVQFEARAKWDAWAKLKGMSKEEAMQKYIDLVAAGKNLNNIPKYRSLESRTNGDNNITMQEMKIGNNTLPLQTTKKRNSTDTQNNLPRRVKRRIIRVMVMSMMHG